MKKLLVIFTLIFSINSFSQTTTEKWNTLNNRYEYFNSDGTMIGYKKYDSLRDRWEYYDLRTTNNSSQVQQPVNSVDFEVVDKVLGSKQKSFDKNVSKIKDKIKLIYNSFDYIVLEGSDKTESDYKFANHLKSLFQAEYIKTVEKKKYDYSNSTLTNEVLTYLENGSISIVKKEYAFLKNSDIEFYNLVIDAFKNLISK